MPKLTQGPHLGDLLKYEAEHYYSRETLDVAPQQDLKRGMVIALKDDQVVAFDPSAEESSQHPKGVLLEDVQTEKDPGKALCLVRHGIVLEDGLLWPEDLEEEDKTKALLDLKTLGILTRKGL